MPARARRTRFTVYDATHRAARAEAVAAYRPGQRCVLGGEPLTCHPRFLDLAHNTEHTGYLGLSCRFHNRSEGATRGNRRRGLLRHPERAARYLSAPSTPSRDW